MAKWKNYKKHKPKMDNSYIVAWRPVKINPMFSGHFYAIWNYDFNDGFEISGPAKNYWDSDIEIIAWRKLPKEYKGEDENEN